VRVDRARVLLAEDNAANRKLALAMLERLGYAAEAVVNGVEAVRAAGSVVYDAVLMDCRMPEVDGFQATAEIRRRETLASSHRTPIIAMTADAMEDDRRRCLEAGMDDYLSKPVSLESLAAALERWVAPADEGTSPQSATSDSRAQGSVGDDGSPLDPQIIADLRRLGTGRAHGAMSGLISSFVRDAESNLERLHHALDREDVETVADRSHALAGSTATVGARGMSQLCVRLKGLVSEGHLEAARGTLADIAAELDRVRVALRAEFPASEEAAT